MGKIILAALPKTEQDTLISQLLPLEKFTTNTLTDKQLLLENLATVPEFGYVIDDEEFLVGSRGLACPVLNDHAQTVAAVSISGPSARLTKKHLLEFLPLVRMAAEKLSQETVLWWVLPKNGFS
jgi:IclR family acetate operon transcriptional repressor